MRALNLKVLRDLIQMKAQILTISLVVGCGITVLVSSLSAYRSLKTAQTHFYQWSHFPDVFANLKRAPQELSERIERFEDVESLELRVVWEATLEIPEFQEPVIGKFVSLPLSGAPLHNRLHIQKGRMPEPSSQSEVLVSEGFAKAHGLEPGDPLSAIFNGRYKRLVVAGVAVSPEYIYVLRGASPFPGD